jgi:predicted O-methyltransferase YrrM
MQDYTIEDIQGIIDAEPEATGDAFLDHRYETHYVKFGHHWPYYRAFYRLAKQLQPLLVVELGGWQGTAAAHFAGGCQGATVITIDHHTDPGDEVNKTLMEAAAERYHNLIYLQGWSNGELAEEEKGKHSLGNAANALPAVRSYGEDIDILFIDSWHDYGHAKQDWDIYRPLLADGALVICDDIIGGYGPAISGMLDFWNELPEPKFLNSRIHPNSNIGFIKYAKD